MLNRAFFNIHDIVLIGAVVIIVHMLASPLYDRLDATIGGN